MKDYFIKAVIATLFFAVFTLLMDAVFGQFDTFRVYVVKFVVFGVLVGVFHYLDDKGWNSWKKVKTLFRGSKQD